MCSNIAWKWYENYYDVSQFYVTNLLYSLVTEYHVSVFSRNYYVTLSPKNYTGACLIATRKTSSVIMSAYGHGCPRFARCERICVPVESLDISSASLGSTLHVNSPDKKPEKEKQLGLCKWPTCGHRQATISGSRHDTRQQSPAWQLHQVAFQWSYCALKNPRSTLNETV